MKRFHMSSVLGVAAFGALVLAGSSAWAGCGDGLKVTPADWHGAPVHEGESGLISVNNGTPSIIGLWNVQFYVGGALFDFGYSQWHSDGTEILNSGGRAPATENFCLGVWDQTGPFTYKLNHFALSYDAGTGKLNAKINIKETVQLDQKGQSYSGGFSIDVYDPNSNALQQHVAGQVAGQRITAGS